MERRKEENGTIFIFRHRRGAEHHALQRLSDRTKER